MEQVNIICMKWGTKYGSEYVNRLRSMVGRHLQRPFRFVCLTDNQVGLESGIEAFPLIRLDIPNGPERGWDKLTTFSKPLYDLQGQTLFLDLDIVIVNSIDCFFDFPARFAIIKDWVKKDVTGNSSVYRFEANAHPDILENFRQQHAKVRETVRNEQEYLSQYVQSHGGLSYWPFEWCQSFKYHCNRKGLGSWLKPPQLPQGARIVVFHGNPNPPDAIAGRSGKWYRKVLPTPWVAEHWR